MTGTSQIYLYPRLDPNAADTLLRECGSGTLLDLRSLGGLSHPETTYSPTGGLPVPESRLAEIQSGMRQMCDEFGFPVQLPSGRQGEFDRVCGTWLRATMDIVPAEAAEEGVWSFLTLVVLPEVAPWRFPDRHVDRLLGKPRNALRRLWWRAHVLGPDLTWAPPGCSPLNEDEFTQIMERSTISGNRRLAQVLKQALWRLERDKPETNRSASLRDVIKLVRATRSYIAVDAMSNEALSRHVDTLFEESAARLATLAPR